VISNFIKAINKTETMRRKLRPAESIALARVMEDYLEWRTQDREKRRH
jgi:hypothetical protein